VTADAHVTAHRDADREHASGVRGALRDIFRPHSHDAFQSVDTALEATERGISAVKISFVGLLLTALVQVAIVFVTGSIALVADTIHNFSDALTAVPLFIAFRLAQREPNRRYTYGYQRAEDIAGVFVIAMIAISSVIAAAEAVDRLFNPRRVTDVGVLVVAGLVGFVGNELVALYRIREGNAIGSAALVADGRHARTDGFTSLAVALGALGVWAGFDRADPLVGIGISVAIFAILVGAAKPVYHRLMDAVDPALVDQVDAIARSTPGVAGVSAVQMRWLGHRLAADIAIAVDGTLPVHEGHHIAELVRRHLLEGVAHLDEVRVHVDPDGDADAHRYEHLHP